MGASSAAAILSIALIPCVLAAYPASQHPDFSRDVAQRQQRANSGSSTLQAKFAPTDPQKTLLFVGQDRDSIFQYIDGTAHGSKVSGVTVYTGLDGGDDGSIKGLSSEVGENPTDYGAGIIDATASLSRLPHAALSIGFDITDTTGGAIAGGAHDEDLRKLAKYIRGLSPRPVFLRIGYEADGPWNNYAPASDYITGFRYIANFLRYTENLDNMVTVWQLATSSYTKNTDSSQWWPGEDVVDWVGGSYFIYEESEWNDLFYIARQYGKPVFVCESAPQGFDVPRQTKASTIGTGSNAFYVGSDAIWKAWFEPFFAFLDVHREEIRAVAYISADWNSQEMWNSGKNGYWGDTRVSADGDIRGRWEAKVGDASRWVHADAGLVDQLRQN